MSALPLPLLASRVGALTGVRGEPVYAVRCRVIIGMDEVDWGPQVNNIICSDSAALALDPHNMQPADGVPVIVHQVSIYVTGHCDNCSHALEVAAVIRGTYPQVVVEVIDLACPQSPVPDCVFAVPTYLLDGRIWSLGNPSSQQIETTFATLA